MSVGLWEHERAQSSVGPFGDGKSSFTPPLPGSCGELIGMFY